MKAAGLEVANHRILLNPFVLLAGIAAAPLIATLLMGWSLITWIQVFVVGLTVFAVWVGLASSGE